MPSLKRKEDDNATAAPATDKDGEKGEGKDDNKEEQGDDADARKTLRLLEFLEV